MTPVGVLIVAWALCRMAAHTDPEVAPTAARTRRLTADPGVVAPPPAPGEAGQGHATAEKQTRP